MGLLLCDDLIFTSKVVGTAKALGLSVTSAHTTQGLIELARKTRPRCVIVDLQYPKLDLKELMRELREACHEMPRVVGYGPHVDVETLKEARQVGCDPVYPRSKFVEDLPTALPEWLGVPHD